MAIDTAATLRALAQTCRSLARSSTTPGAADSLNEIARDYTEQAERADEVEAKARVVPGESPAKH